MIKLRWGIDGPTVEFEEGAGEYRADVNSLSIQLRRNVLLGGCSAEARIPGGLILVGRGGCQQTALDRLHARLREVAAEITAAL